MLTVLYDGWEVIHAPDSPAALHTLAVLAANAPNVRSVLALPGQAPVWIPAGVDPIVHATGVSGYDHLRWVQGTLPKLAEQTGASLIHLTGAVPLRKAGDCVFSPAGDLPLQVSTSGPMRKRGIWERLLESLSAGALSQAKALFWPEDLPSPRLDGPPTYNLPPLTHPDFTPTGGGNGNLQSYRLPDTYVLYQGPNQQDDIPRLLEGWSWAAGSVGQDFPLVIAGLSPGEKQTVEAALAGNELETTIRTLPEISPQLLALVYRGARAVFHPAGITPWGNPVRNALACAKPLAAAESEWTDAIVGNAGYLAPVDDPRSLGAALLTIIVEESVGEKLAGEALKRSASWKQSDFGARLSRIYQELVRK